MEPSLRTFEDNLLTVGESLLLDERWGVRRDGAAVDVFHFGGRGEGERLGEVQ